MYIRLKIRHVTQKKTDKKTPLTNIQHSVVQTIKQLDRRIFLFLIFLVISSILWLMNALSKDYITDVECPVEFYNIPDNYVFIGEYPQSVKLQVSGRGFSLLKYSLGSIALPFNIDLQSYFSGYEDDSQSIQFQYYLNSKKEQITRFLNDEVSVLDITPGTIELKFDRLHQKMVKLVPQTNLKWAPQYRQKGKMVTSPDSVLVKGPKSIIDTLTRVRTTVIKDENIKESKTYETQLVKPEQCKLSANKASVRLSTSQFTENTVKIPIRIINKPDSVNLTIFPNSVNVTYLVSFDNFTRIKPEDFQAAIDYMDIKKQSTPQELRVNLLFVPEETQLVRYWPEKARFIISEK